MVCMASETIKCEDCGWSKEITADSEDMADKKEQSLNGHKLHCPGSSEGSEEGDNQDGSEGQGNGSQAGSGLSLPVPSVPWYAPVGVLVAGGLILWYRGRDEQGEEEDDTGSESGDGQDDDGFDIDSGKDQPGKGFI